MKYGFSIIFFVWYHFSYVYHLFKLQATVPGKVYDPITAYLDVNNVPYGVVCERVRSKAYHDMMTFLVNGGQSKDSAKQCARVAGQYWLDLFKQKRPT